MSTRKPGEPNEIIHVSFVKKLYQVEFGDGDAVELSEDSFLDFHLYEGKVLTPSERRELIRFASGDLLYTYCLKLLAKERYTVHAIKERLEKKGASEEQIKTIVRRLRDVNLLDDELFAKTYAEDVSDLRMYGKYKIARNLRLKGVPFEIIDKLPFPEEKEMEKAMRYVAYANKSDTKTPNARRSIKVQRALVERGFAEEIAEEAVKHGLNAIPEAVEKESLEHDFNLCYPKYARKYKGYLLRQHCFAYLVRKGYRYDDIRERLDKELNDDE